MSQEQQEQQEQQVTEPKHPYEFLKEEYEISKEKGFIGTFEQYLTLRDYT